VTWSLPIERAHRVASSAGSLTFVGGAGDTYFREPAAVATVVPCHALWPEGALTKVEVLGMRAYRNGFDKYIPRDDRWPERVWDWPISVPYRQGVRLRNTI